MYNTNEPWIFAAVVLGVFIFTAIAFFLFNFLVQRRQRILSTVAARQSAIVSSLFPKKIQMKLMQEQEEAEKQMRMSAGMAGIRKYLLTENISSTGTQAEDKSQPIADLFPDATIMFADIAGGCTRPCLGMIACVTSDTAASFRFAQDSLPGVLPESRRRCLLCSRVSASSLTCKPREDACLRWRWWETATLQSVDFLTLKRSTLLSWLALL